MVGVARGHQRADTLKPYSQKTSQSNHTRTTALSNSMLSHANSLQSCLTLCDPIEGSPPGSPVPGILQARTLEWVAISFSNAWKWKWKWSRSVLTPWTAAHQAPPSTGFPRRECWSGVPLGLSTTSLLCNKTFPESVICSPRHLWEAAVLSQSRWEEPGN